MAQQDNRGAITGLTLASDNPGELLISWDKPDPEPSDYRISWTPAGEKFVGWAAPNEEDRGNAYPDGDLLSFTVVDLRAGAEYRVRMRARYNDGVYASDPWSGPWVNATTTLPSAPEPTRPGSTTPAAATTPVATTTPAATTTSATTSPDSARELLWSHTFTVEKFTYPISHMGFNALDDDEVDHRRITLPGGTTAWLANAATAGAGLPLYFTVSGTTDNFHEHALMLMVGEKELALSDAVIVANAVGRTPYAWPEEGEDWSVGDSVELKLYHLTDEPAPTLQRLKLPGRVLEATLVPTESAGLTVRWESPANAVDTRLRDYTVYLTRNDGECSEAQTRVFTPSDTRGELLWVTFTGGRRRGVQSSGVLT